MRHVRLLAATITLAAFLAAPAVAAAANRYVTYVACSTSKTAPAATSCSKSSDKAAFFKSRDASVAYVVCVKFPTGVKLCATAPPAQKGKTYVNKITSNVKGTHTVTWKVNGVKVGSWTFQVT